MQRRIRIVVSADKPRAPDDFVQTVSACMKKLSQDGREPQFGASR